MFTRVVLFILCTNAVTLFGQRSLENNLWKTWRNSTFYAFRGIKYAESPTGELRFKAPQPVGTWNNITAILAQPLDEDGSDCPSPNASYNEDCLFLNVYTKELKESNLKPVIVFIHPGGLYLGSGSSSNFGPEYLLDEDLVLVTFNYRLAFFGFTSIGSEEAIGNAGFKDQALVLKWVHDHIRHFGGDPNCVTLMGDSAGAMSVSLHMVSPLSQHLFHRAFVMSGGILPQIRYPFSQLNLVRKIARTIGCSNGEDAFHCVKRTDTAKITNSLRKMFEFGWDNPIYPWLPIVEPKNGVEVPFLDEDPIKLFERQKFNRIPVMVSVTKDETATSAMYLFEHRDLLLEWFNDFSRIGPICMQYEANETISKAMKQNYASFDLNDEHRYKDVFVRTVEAFSDSAIIFPLYRFAQLVKGATDVYYLKFNFHGPYSNFKCNSTLHKGFCDEIQSLNIVEHCDDLQYLFTSSNIPQITNEFSVEGQIVAKFTKLLYSFAKNGAPYFGSDIAATDVKFNEDEIFINFDSTFTIDEKPFKNAPLWDFLFAVNKKKVDF